MFSMPSTVVIGSQVDFFMNLPSINDENHYLRAVHRNQTIPTVDFSKYTVLAFLSNLKAMLISMQ